MRLSKVKYIVMLGLVVPGISVAGTYAVNAGRPDLLNETLKSSEIRGQTKTIIKDPILTLDKKVEEAVVQKNQKLIKPLRESIQKFNSVSIDGRRSRPRVEFSLPTLPLERVDETYSIQAAEKILEGK